MTTEKNALVTGASRGIGAAIAARLAADGWRVAVNYRQSRAAAEALCREINAKRPGAAVALPADVSAEADAAALCRDAADALGPISLLVNNAGVGHFGLLSDITPAEWRRLFAVNVEGAFLCTRALLPSMIGQKRGCIINISSIWGLVGASCEVAYSASKGALLAFTKALAKELGPSGIRVNCVAPGLIDTQMNSRLAGDELAELVDATPLMRIGRPEDVANAVAWLASDEAAFITGQVISPNGGFTMI